MKRITIALSDDLHAQLKDAAEREHRSLTSQMRVYLERGLDVATPVLEAHYSYKSGDPDWQDKRA